jgi:ribonuclease-3
MLAAECNHTTDTAAVRQHKQSRCLREMRSTQNSRADRARSSGGSPSAAAPAAGSTAASTSLSAAGLSEERKQSLQAFSQSKLSYTFRDLQLLDAALTHSSFSTPEANLHWRRLAWLGDRALNLTVAEYIFHHSDADSAPGDMNPVYCRQTSRLYCKMVAQRIGLADVLHQDIHFSLRGSHVWHLSNTDVLAETMEAVIGAIDEDRGLLACIQIVRRLWFDWPEKPTFVTPASSAATAGAAPAPYDNPVSQLQEWAQQRYQSPPQYTQGHAGSDHAPSHYCAVVIQDGTTTQAGGATAADAKKAAAGRMLSLLRARPGGLGLTVAEALLAEKIKSDPISAAFELAAKQHIQPPSFEESGSGPFSYTVRLRTDRSLVIGEGEAKEGQGKQVAKEAAARALLKELGFK